MPPQLLLFIFFRTILAALPHLEAERKVLDLTISEKVKVTTLFTANPLLKRLHMFSDSPMKPRSLPSTTSLPPPAIDKKIVSRSPGDNFHALYKRLNESLFEMAAPDERQIGPNENAVLNGDTDDEWVEEAEAEERIEPREKKTPVEEEEPFAVTESLLSSLQPQEPPIPPTPPPFWDATNRPPAMRTFSPLPESQSSEPVIEDEVKEVHRSEERELHEGENIGKGTILPNKKEPLVPLHRASEWQVQNSGVGRFLVSGTQFYEDKRIDGGVMVEEYSPSGNGREVDHMRQDTRYMVEAELTRMRAHAAALKKTENPIIRGSKTLASNRGIPLDNRIDRFPERVYPSTSQIVERNGRKIEIRKIDRQGKEVQVELANPILWNHDYISAPGVVIHGTLKKGPKRLKLASVSKCFEAVEATRLAGVIPIDRKISPTAKDCLQMCAKSPLCKTVVYEESLSMCEVFSERPGQGGSSFQGSSSSTLFEPIVEDPERCLSSSGRRAKVHAAPTVKKAEETIQRCAPGEDYILTRQEGVRSVGADWKEKFITNEDDCVSACLMGPKTCIAAGYSHEKQECIIYSKTAANIEVHEPTTLYSKMCVSERVATKCSGATVDHVHQAVLLSSMREAKKVADKGACLDACLRAEYNCMSIMFYAKERTNCILNDGSISTAPDSFVEELSREVEYFGVEECYGIQDVTHRSNYIVEDDIRAGQITQGSHVETFRLHRYH